MAPLALKAFMQQGAPYAFPHKLPGGSDVGRIWMCQHQVILHCRVQHGVVLNKKTSICNGYSHCSVNGSTVSLISGMQDTRSIRSKARKVKEASSEANSQSQSCINYTFQSEKVRAYFGSDMAPI